MNVEDRKIQYYKEYHAKRTKLRIFLGGVYRFVVYVKYWTIRLVARYKGAQVGNDTMMPLSFAWHANKNLTIGDDCVIGDNVIFDLRSSIVIGNHCIINNDVQIIRVSHYIDDNTMFSTRYYPPLIVGDYVWLATGSKILPSCCKIEEGGIIGAYSVLVKDTTKMGVYSGNPALLLRKHNTKFEDLVVVSMLGGDFFLFYKTI